MTVGIYTERFHLRELDTADASERYLGWFKDTLAARYITTSAGSLTELREYIQTKMGRKDVLFMGIFDRATDRHIGNIKYEPVNTDAGYAIMGILIGEPEYRGKRVTHEVLVASAMWLQVHRGIRQIALGVHAENSAAIRAYERVGFVVEDTTHIAGPHPESLTMVWHI